VLQRVLTLGPLVIARTRFTPDRSIQRRQCPFRVDAGGPVDLRHHVDVKVSLGIVPRGGRADHETTLRVKELNAPVQDAVLAVDPLVDRLVVIDGLLIVTGRELDPDGNVGQHHVQDAVARGLPQKTIRVIHASPIGLSAFPAEGLPHQQTCNFLVRHGIIVDNA